MCKLKIKSIVVSGTSSGVGKTSITCGIIYALKQLGYSIQPFKVGPDYIDPMYLSCISGNTSHNLDVWLMGKEHLVSSFVSNSNSDISVIEGVMGYYDGFGGSTNYASTHHVATLTNSPVILILDASKTSRSIAATLLGFLRFHKKSQISGIILNKIGSKKHESLCRQAIEKTNIPILGVIPNNSQLSIQSRHLGLVSTLDKSTLLNNIRKVARQISKHIDTSLLVKIIKPFKYHKITKHSKISKITIAVALDNSFNFYYNDNLNALRREGATLKFFSPINSRHVPRCDGLYIGGGFPEVLGADLERNTIIKKEIKQLADDGIPIYAECGGLMYLTKSIQCNNKEYKMVGLFDAYTKMTKNMTLNYTKGKMSKSVISDSSATFRGHEFHYSKIDVPSDSKFAYDLDIGDGIIAGQDGLVQDMTLATFGHLYFDSNQYANTFVQNCARYKRL